jgi:hypothetical protein
MIDKELDDNIETDIREIVFKGETPDRRGSESCPVASFFVSGIETCGTLSRVFYDFASSQSGQM